MCNSTCLKTLFGIDPMRAIFRLMSDDVNSAFTLSLLQGSDGESPSRENLSFNKIQIYVSVFLTSAVPEVLHFISRFIEINAQLRH